MVHDLLQVTLAMFHYSSHYGKLLSLSNRKPCFFLLVHSYSFYREEAPTAMLQSQEQSERKTFYKTLGNISATV